MIAVRDQAEFECIVAYIHMNPVRADWSSAALAD